MLFNTYFSGAFQKKVKSGFILGAIVWGMWNDLPGWDLKLVMDSGHANPSQTSHPKPRPLVKNVPCEHSSIMVNMSTGELSSGSAIKSPKPWDVSWTEGVTLATAGFFLSISQCQCIQIPWKQRRSWVLILLHLITAITIIILSQYSPTPCDKGAIPKHALNVWGGNK